MLFNKAISFELMAHIYFKTFRKFKLYRLC